ncbi:MAG: excinuclease ABC subunit UvrB [Ruminococcaceae bacterium]|nr:excinuclease ABC subunit UvrB [Oscillospiraceae bacterium]
MEQNKFKLVSDYKPTGDQPQAIETLTNAIKNGNKMQTLLGVTGSGKTFTMANIIANLNRPTLILEPNKTLAAQVCTEMRALFPENAVEYFVSYYDYYQPEAYIPGKDIYIEKDAMVNDEIDKLRHSATSALFERRDVIIVASVSCIYSLGDPEEYHNMVIDVREGMEMDRDTLVRRLVGMNYERNDINFVRDKFRIRGDVVEILPASSSDKAIRIEFFGEEIERISEINIVTGEVIRHLTFCSIFPANHYVVSDAKRERALKEIEEEMVERVAFFKSENKLLEAQRIEERTRYDLEMLREIGFCSGVENYSRVLAGREPGSTPHTLLDYFPEDFIMFVDESHVMLPQVRGMSGGDLARKKNLVEFGFRLPSAYDNRPLYYNEFLSKLNQTVFVSATPADFEKQNSTVVAEQLIRPTGLVDPEIEVRPIEAQVDDVMGEIRIRAERGERVLVTTLTTKMAEDLTEYLASNNIKVKYIHHNVETIERMEIIRALRLGEFDVLVGINLLREGLDIPEVSLVAILDADKEGLLRSETSLIQTVGRAARNANGKVIMYADTITRSMKSAIDETNRRRKVQTEYNKAHGIIPKTIVKDVYDVIDLGKKTEESKKTKKMSASERARLIEQLTSQMREASRKLEFEKAAYLRDKIRELQITKQEKGKND